MLSESHLTRKVIRAFPGASNDVSYFVSAEVNWKNKMADSLVQM